MDRIIVRLLGKLLRYFANRIEPEYVTKFGRIPLYTESLTEGEKPPYECITSKQIKNKEFYLLIKRSIWGNDL
jgi:hypothetical protein